MARRKDSVFDDLYAIAAMLPWKVSVALAVVCFIVLHWFASQDPVTATSTKEIGSVAVRQMFRMAAMIGQVIVPIILLGGAAASFFAQRRRAELVDTVAASDSASSLSQMSWREFEALVQEAFRLRGYSVQRLGGDGPDGGVDLVLERDGEKTLVQCKQWRAFKVGVSVVRELYGVMAAQGATAGIVVTSGTFSQDAIDFAEGRNVRLIEGEELHGMIREARAAKPLPTGLTRDVTGSAAAAPGCPRCGSPMVRRTAKRGASAGQAFYGCSRYPACKGTISG
jgi:restriction system protein